MSPKDIDCHPGHSHGEKIAGVVSEGKVLGHADGESKEFKDLRSVDRDSAVAGKCLIYLAHNGYDAGVKLETSWYKHIGIANLLVAFLSLSLF
jgi:hypothetical protein